jgi:hypothetical protein
VLCTKFIRNLVQSTTICPVGATNLGKIMVPEELISSKLCCGVAAP